MTRSDLVLLEGARTPMADYNGSFAEVSAIELAAVAARAALERSGVPAAAVDHTVVGNALQTSADAIYGARHVAEAGHDLTVQGWVGPDHSVAHVSPAKWMKSNIPEAPVAGRSNSLMGEMALTRAGIGIAVLPCYLGDADEDLQRLDGPEPLITVDVWLLMHDDLRRTARVRAVMDILASSLAKLRPLLDRDAPAVE